MTLARPFSLTRGGPFNRLLRAGHLDTGFGQVLLALLAWIPLLAISVSRHAFGGRPDPLLLDASVHVRLLIAIPLFAVAEGLLEHRCNTAVKLLQLERIADREVIARVLASGERLASSWLPEAGIALTALTLAAVTLWSEPRTLAGAWYYAVALPLMQFVMVRWLWRWLVWAYVLMRMSRQELDLETMHPDAAGGLRILTGPIDAFTIYAAAVASILSSSAIVRCTQGGESVEAQIPGLATFVVAALLLGCGPLFMFTRQLYNAGYRDIGAYHAFARAYIRAFRAKWLMTDEGGEAALGVSDIQSLNDLGGSYLTTVRTKNIPFDFGTVAQIAAGAIGPLLPLALVVVPLSQIALRLGKMLLGL